MEIRFREIGPDVGRRGIKDHEIVPLLHRLGPVTFFSLDSDFYKAHLCHPRYCLVHLQVEYHEAAAFIRRLLRHPSFDTQAKRAGTAISVSHTRLRVWKLHSERETEFRWPAP